MHDCGLLLRRLLDQQEVDVPQLERAYQDLEYNPGWEPWLAARLEELDARQQPHATWLLLRSADDRPPSPAVLQRVLEAAVEPWNARLHVCQLFARASCPPAMTDVALERLAACASDRRPFIRAWALSALHRLAVDNPALRPDVESLLRRAALDTSKSVQARLRRLGPLPSER